MFKKIFVGVIALSLLASSVYATVTAGPFKTTTWGNKRVTYGYVAITGAPTSSGYAVTARKLGLNIIERVFVYPSSTYPDVEWTYTGGSLGVSSSSGYFVPMRNSLIDKRQILSAGASDSIPVVSMKPGGWSADAETASVLIAPFSGSIARLYAPLPTCATVANGVTGLQDNIFAASDGVTLGSVSDTGLASGGPILRTNWCRGDTVYFLPAYSGDPAVRLGYSGRATMGAAVAGADLYVPFGLGNYIKVAKLSGAALYTAGARALHYVPNGALTAKFVANKTAGAKVGADPIIVYRTPTTTTGFTTILYYMAIGN